MSEEYQVNLEAAIYKHGEWARLDSFKVTIEGSLSTLMGASEGASKSLGDGIESILCNMWSDEVKAALAEAQAAASAGIAPESVELEEELPE